MSGTLAAIDTQISSKSEDHDAVDDTSPASPTQLKGHRRTSSSVSGVFSPAELEEQKKDLQLAKDVSKLNWKINTSANSLGEPDIIKKLLTTPPVSRIDLQFPLGLHVTARNRKGVTIKDALDAIHKSFKKRADDELDEPILAGFIYDPADFGYGTLRVVLKKEGAAPPKKKGKGEA